MLDLPAIDARLVARGIDDALRSSAPGPTRRALRDAWVQRPVQWTGALDHGATLDRLHGFDLFVLPTRAEGLPVALSDHGRGLVHPSSATSSGIPEVVDDGVPDAVLASR